MRASLAIIAVVVASVGSAYAGVDVVVLGPAASGPVSSVHQTTVKAVLRHAAIGPAVDRQIDAACAADLACLTSAGAELGAARVLAVTLAEGKGTLTIGLALADVVGKEMIAVRDLALPEKRIAKDLEPAVRKFLDEAPTDRAKALFAEGNQHFSLNEFDQALGLYQRAYRIRPMPAFLFNMAQCQRKLGNYKDAINLYQAYLVGVPDAANKAVVDSLIAESKQAIADQQARHDQELRLQADTERKKAEEGRIGKEAEARAAEDRMKAEQEKTARLARERELYNRHPVRKWMIITGALGAAALGVGGYFAVEENKLQQDFDNAGCGTSRRNLDQAQLATCTSQISTAQRDATRANVLFVAGGAGLVGSLVVLALDPGNVRPTERPPVALHVSPTSVQLVVSW